MSVWKQVSSLAGSPTGLPGASLAAALGKRRPSEGKPKYYCMTCGRKPLEIHLGSLRPCFILPKYHSRCHQERSRHQPLVGLIWADASPCNGGSLLDSTNRTTDTVVWEGLESTFSTCGLSWSPSPCLIPGDLSHFGAPSSLSPAELASQSPSSPSLTSPSHELAKVPSIPIGAHLSP